MPTNGAPFFAAASSSASASPAEGMRTARPAPPAIASSGRISSAASAEPKRLMRSRKVAGPTLGVRISRSQESRCRSLRRGGVCVACSTLRPDLALGAGEQPRDVGAVLDEDDDAHDREEDREVRPAP